MAALNTTSNTAFPSLPNVSNFLTIKLDRTNYLLWQAQLILEWSRGLLSFVDGSKKSPPAFLSDDAGNLTDTVNPAFEDLIKQDQILFSRLTSSLTPAVLSSVSTIVNKISAADAWSTLEERYASASHNRIDRARVGWTELAIMGNWFGRVGIDCWEQPWKQWKGKHIGFWECRSLDVALGYHKRLLEEIMSYIKLMDTEQCDLYFLL